MDSWPEKQLQLMKNGGNQTCNDYLQKHGIGPRTPIRQKYDSPAAQLYKEVLKARVEGRPEPTQLPPKPVAAAPTTRNPANAMATSGGLDPNGMERLMGESDDQYVARQTRLREEARARMASKFGGSGMGGGMSNGGGSGGGGRMQGIGSDPSYNPNAGYGGGDLDVNAMISGFGSMLGSAVSGAKSLADEQTVNRVKSTGASFWGGLTSSVSHLASAIAAPEDGGGSGGMDGLSELQRQVHAQRTGNTKYAGFGSDSTSTMMNGSTTTNNSSSLPPGNSFATGARTGSASSMNSMGSSRNSSGGLQEAPGLPNEDRNGVERLTGETEEQYVVRQTRLRDEAKARMAAKFGGGGMGMGGVGSGGGGTSSVVSAPGSGNLFSSSNTPNRAGVQSAPVSGNAPRLNTTSGFPRSKTPPKKVMNSTDFFSSFGE